MRTGSRAVRLVGLSLLLSGAASAGAKEKVVVWDPSNGTATCSTVVKQTSGANQEKSRSFEDCYQVEMRNGQILVVRVKGALLGAYTYEKAVEDVSTQVVTPNAGLPWPKAASTAPAAKPGERTSATFAGCVASKTVKDVQVMVEEKTAGQAEYAYHDAASDPTKRGKLSQVVGKGDIPDADLTSLGLSAVEKGLLQVVGRQLTEQDVDDLDLSPEDRAKVDECKGGALFRLPVQKVPEELKAYGRFLTALDELLAALRSHQLESYGALLHRARRTRRNLLAALGLSEAAGGQTVADKMAELSSISEGDKTTFKDTWDRHTTLLSTLPSGTSDAQIMVFEFGSASPAVNSDFTLHLKAKPTALIPGAVERNVFVRVKLKYRWVYSVASGVMFSGLVGDSYSKKTVVDERNADGTVKRSHNELVAETRDSFNTEAAIMGVLYPMHDSFWTNVGIFLGVGVDSNVTTRYYGGLAYRLGRVATLSAGLAMGKVKTLKQNVDVKDVGTLEPGDAVRDKSRKSFVVGLSFSLSQN